MKKNTRKSSKTQHMRDGIKLHLKDYFAKQTDGLSAKKPFLLQQLIYFIAATSILSFACAFVAFKTSNLEYPIVWFLMPVIFILPIWYVVSVILKVHDAMIRIYVALRHANKGEIYHRIPQVPGLGGVGKDIWELNEFLDLSESFFKETMTCFDNVSKNNFDRIGLTKGMPGLFGRSLSSVNQSIVAMSKNASLVASNDLHSKLHSVNIKNLIHSMQHSQDDLISVRHRIEEVQGIAIENNDEASSNQTNVQNMVDSLVKITSSINEVSNVVNQLGDDSEKVKSALAMITDIADEISQQAGGFRAQFDRFALGAQQTIQNINIAKDQVQNLQVKFSHIIYMQNGYISLDENTVSNETLNAVQVSHDQCQFGDWYYSGSAEQSYGNTRSFQYLAEPHKNLHAAVQDAIAASQENWLYDNSIKDRIVDSMTRAEEESKLMGEYLDNMLKEKHNI